MKRAVYKSGFACVGSIGVSEPSPCRGCVKYEKTTEARLYLTGSGRILTNRGLYHICDGLLLFTASGDTVIIDEGDDCLSIGICHIAESNTRLSKFLAAQSSCMAYVMKEKEAQHLWVRLVDAQSFFAACKTEREITVLLARNETENILLTFMRGIHEAEREGRIVISGSLPIYPENIADVIIYIKKNYTYPALCTLERLAAVAKCSTEFLSRQFKKKTGVSLTDFIRRCRLSRAAWLLINTSKAPESIARSVGISGYSYFITSFKKEFGVTPLRYRNGFRSYNTVI
jgi:AraC-like DNA-binding protein